MPSRIQSPTRARPGGMMNKPVKQHLIDPEICIRCYTCEMTCPIEAITHDDDNVVVDFEKCAELTGRQDERSGAQKNEAVERFRLEHGHPT